jgi:hypothetical protein
MAASKSEIDRVLEPVAEGRGRLADEILDFREAVLGRRDPGQCVQCYFKIFGRLGPVGSLPLGGLREWIEENLEVIAVDGRARELERVPVQLEAESLEDFCHRMIGEFRENRVYREPEIELRFAFKESTAA